MHLIPTRVGKAALGVAAACALFAAVAGPASAQTAARVDWKCKASAVTVQALGGSVLDPVKAGRDDTVCVPSTVGLPNVGEALTLEDLIKARTAYAATTIGAEPRVLERKPGSAAGVEGLELNLGGLVVGVGAARSTITASCVAGQPKYEPFSEVANITINGTPILLDGVLQPITDALSDALGAVLEVRLNESVDVEGGGKAIRAARITVLKEAGTVAEAIIAQSTVGNIGAVCDPNAPGNATEGGGTPPGGGAAGAGSSGSNLDGVCPEGSAFDVNRKVCVIPVPGSVTAANPLGDLTGPGSVVIGPPYEAPSGGRVYTLTDARTKFKSPCLSGPGPNYVIVGTNGRDRITGTNKADRMLGRGGIDRIDGGRTADCLDGGSERDVLTGGQDNDRVFGGTGNDSLNGDTGNDRLSGGAGRDTIVGAYGADIALGGAGNDIINVAVAGRRATVDGGAGSDVARVNPDEARSVKRVERIVVIRRGSR